MYSILFLTAIYVPSWHVGEWRGLDQNLCGDLVSSIGSNRKESRPMESQKLPESSDLEQSSNPLSLLHSV